MKNYIVSVLILLSTSLRAEDNFLSILSFFRTNYLASVAFMKGLDDDQFEEKLQDRDHLISFLSEESLRLFYTCSGSYVSMGVEFLPWIFPAPPPILGIDNQQYYNEMLSEEDDDEEMDYIGKIYRPFQKIMASHFDEDSRCYKHAINIKRIADLLL